MGSREVSDKKNESLGDQVYGAIKDRIITSKLKPHQKLIEQTIASEMGTSRTPVREALWRLEKEGLVFRLSGVGFAVNGTSAQEVEDVLDLQSVLEVYATRLAASRITEGELRALDDLIGRQERCLAKADVKTFIRLDGKFHDAIHRAAKHAQLYGLMQSLKHYIDRYRVMVFRSHANLQLSIKDHKVIVGLIRTKNVKEIERVVDKHMTRANNFIKRTIRWGRNGR